MALRKIATVGHPILRTVARPLSDDEIRSPKTQAFIDDLVETMHDANGAGLAATQIFEPIRICAIHVHDNPRYPYKPNVPLTILVNPVLEKLSEETFDNYEGCLSVPNLRGVVPRSVHVRVSAKDREANPLSFEVKGLTAGTFQHELDHLDGKVFVDRVEDSRTLTTWGDFERHHMAAFVERARAIVAKYGG